jgi:hypothetical protein
MPWKAHSEAETWPPATHLIPCSDTSDKQVRPFPFFGLLLLLLFIAAAVVFLYCCFCC